MKYTDKTLENKSSFKNSMLLVLAAVIWGASYVAQSEAAPVGTFSFNTIRMLIGFLVLCPLAFVIRSSKIKHGEQIINSDKKTLWKSGIACGFFLFIAVSFQQLGIMLGSSVGKAGFLTSCYIVFVPVLGLFFKRRSRPTVWISVGIALVGLYFLCVQGSFQIQVPDLLLIACAFAYSAHIIVIDHYSLYVDGLSLSMIQFMVCAILSAIPAVIFEAGPVGFSDWLMPFSDTKVIISILYSGILSCGVGYTLQVFGQRNVNPAVASILMSLESVFSVVAGWILLGETLSLRELIGCILIFAAVLLAQIKIPKVLRKQMR